VFRIRKSLSLFVGSSPFFSHFLGMNQFSETFFCCCCCDLTIVLFSRWQRVLLRKGPLYLNALGNFFAIFTFFNKQKKRDALISSQNCRWNRSQSIDRNPKILARFIFRKITLISNFTSQVATRFSVSHCAWSFFAAITVFSHSLEAKAMHSTWAIALQSYVFVLCSSLSGKLLLSFARLISRLR